MTVQPIESIEIRGITAKLVATMIVCVLSIILSVMASYYSLKSQIHDIQYSKDSDDKLMELKMRTLENKVDLNSINIKSLTEKINEISNNK